MKKEIVVRFMQTHFAHMEKFLQKTEYNELEKQLFILHSYLEGPNERIYLAKMLLTPDPNEIEDQTGVSIAPTAIFQANCYGLADCLTLSPFDVHTHPFCEMPNLSSIDFHNGTKNAKYISTHLGKQSTMGMIVFGGTIRGFDGVVWNRDENRFEPIDRIEILGSPILILDNSNNDNICENDIYARHRIIPGWKQDVLEKLKVFIVGLGGNGSLIYQSCVSLGIGRQGGWVKACDKDTLEESNVPRIPFAYPEDIGKSKAYIAQNYADKKAPDLPVTCYENNIQEAEMQAIAKEAHIIIGAVDNEGGRKVCNSLAVRYSIPYVDLTTEIIPDGTSCEKVGQVSIVIPGRTGCLMCASLIDTSEAALDLLSEEGQALRAKRGYVRGTDLTPTPAVLSLNGVTCYMGMAELLRLIGGEHVNNSEFLHYEQQTHKLMVAGIKPNPDCPVCGKDGYLAEGDEIIPLDKNNHSTQTYELFKGCRTEKNGVLLQTAPAKPNNDDMIESLGKEDVTENTIE